MRFLQMLIGRGYLSIMDEFLKLYKELELDTSSLEFKNACIMICLQDMIKKRTFGSLSYDRLIENIDLDSLRICGSSMAQVQIMRILVDAAEIVLDCRDVEFVCENTHYKVKRGTLGDASDCVVAVKQMLNLKFGSDIERWVKAINKIVDPQCRTTRYLNFDIEDFYSNSTDTFMRDLFDYMILIMQSAYNANDKLFRLKALELYKAGIIVNSEGLGVVPDDWGNYISRLFKYGSSSIANTDSVIKMAMIINKYIRRKESVLDYSEVKQIMEVIGK